jgi:hypothetical protein
LEVHVHAALQQHPTSAKNVFSLRCSADLVSSLPTSNIPFIISGNGVVCTSSARRYLPLALCFVWVIVAKSVGTVSPDPGVTV